MTKRPLTRKKKPNLVLAAGWYVLRTSFVRLRSTPSITQFTQITGWLGALLILSACVGAPTPTPYIPPTLVGTSALAQTAKTQAILATEAAPQESPRPTPTPSCNANLRFLEDLTIPDGTLVEPNATLDKRWWVENSGTCNWDRHYRLKLISGPEMSTAPEKALFPARSGTQAMVRISLIAPEEPGAYRSAWQAFDPQDQPFGDPFFIEVIVPEPGS
jgi:hypothetical protein